jgi:hypothetical protein
MAAHSRVFYRAEANYRVDRHRPSWARRGRADDRRQLPLDLGVAGSGRVCFAVLVRIPRFAATSVRSVAFASMMAGAAIGLGAWPSQATASAPDVMSAGSAPVSATGGGLSNLFGVAATSARSAWAGGAITTGGRTLIEQWNGTTWKHVPSPAEDIGLQGIAAVSASSAWAVSGYSNGETGYSTLILGWNGKAWKRVPSPPGNLYGVAATSAGNAWAVGMVGTPAAPDGKALIVRWNGAGWNTVPSPNPGPGGSRLYGVAAVSAGSAWAVGCNVCLDGPDGSTLIMRWNGAAWKTVPSPSPAHSVLYSVAVTSANSAWAVGYTSTSRGGVALVLHWNGKVWKRVPCPGSVLYSVTATSAQNAWAVGGLGIVHWNGTAWKHVPSPAGALSGVAATSARNAWAVGIGEKGQALILRWNGRLWTQEPGPAV